MLKREYMRERKKLIKEVEKGNISISEFSEKMAVLATNFKSRWSKDISEKGQNLGSKIMKYYGSAQEEEAK